MNGVEGGAPKCPVRNRSGTHTYIFKRRVIEPDGNWLINPPNNPPTPQPEQNSQPEHKLQARGRESISEEILVWILAFRCNGEPNQIRSNPRHIVINKKKIARYEIGSTAAE